LIVAQQTKRSSAAPVRISTSAVQDPDGCARASGLDQQKVLFEFDGHPNLSKENVALLREWGNIDID